MDSGEWQCMIRCWIRWWFKLYLPLQMYFLYWNKSTQSLTCHIQLLSWWMFVILFCLELDSKTSRSFLLSVSGFGLKDSPVYIHCPTTVQACISSLYSIIMSSTGLWSLLYSTSQYTENIMLTECDEQEAAITLETSVTHIKCLKMINPEKLRALWQSY